MGKPTVITGLKKVYIATVTDDVSGVSFGTPVYYPGIQELGFKPKINTAPLWAENQMWDNNVAFESAEISTALASLTSAQRASLLGQTVASGGGVYATVADTPPWVAILYKATLPGGAFRYGVFYKGMFTPPDEDIKGQEGKVEYAIPKLTGTFIPLQYNGIWEWHVDTTDPNGSSMNDETWFAAVTLPTGDVTAPTIASSTPTTGATAVTVGSTYSWAFSEAISPLSVVPDNFFLIKDSDNSVVAGTLNQSADQKTITFTPTSNLSAASAYFACATTGIRDLAGNKLAANSVRKFTTA